MNTVYGVRHESSSYLPCRRRSSPQHKLIEYIQIKSGKRLVLANLSADGSLDKDSLAHALFLHRNMADPIDGLSPAEILYGTNLHGISPLNPQEYKYVNQSNHLNLFLIIYFDFFTLKFLTPFLIQKQKGKKETI